MEVIFTKFLKPDHLASVYRWKFFLEPSRTKAANFSSSPLLAGKIQNMTSQNKEYLASYFVMGI